MLQCKYIETMTQQAKVDLLNALMVTREGYESGDYAIIHCGLCNNVGYCDYSNKYHLSKVLWEMFKNQETPFNVDIKDYEEEEDKSTNPKRMKFLNELIATLEASIEQMAWR